MQITDDHTLKNTMNSPNVPSNVLANSFGGGGKIYVDVDVVSDEVLNGDQFILCSDGLYDELSDQEIEEMLINNSNAKDLVTRVKEKDCNDNVSVLLINYQSR